MDAYHAFHQLAVAVAPGMLYLVKIPKTEVAEVGAGGTVAHLHFPWSLLQARAQWRVASSE